MKVPFKTLSLAVAVATAAAGSSAIHAQSAQLAGNTGLGDLAIVPYYTVREGYATGVSVINSSDRTQVVKVRLRRGSDSMDALDFNVVLSPQDHFGGYVGTSDADSDGIKFYTADSSCTVPSTSAGPSGVPGFEMPDIYREGADEGYIEVIAMGSPLNENMAIAVAAKHDNATGKPKDCARVQDNFRRGNGASDYGDSSSLLTGAVAANGKRGVVDSTRTVQWTTAAGTASVVNSYVDSDNVLKVSYFIKSDVTGTEIGGNAVHIANFLAGPTITNQVGGGGINEGDLQGFDYPDLNGGAPTTILLGEAAAATAGQRDAYVGLRNALGASSVLNDWSKAQTELFGVNTDWVITVPGQYIMTDLAAYIDSLEEDGVPCNTGNVPNGEPGRDDDPDSDTYGEDCDFRDIPLTVTATVYDREEKGVVLDEDDLVVSPQPPGEVTVVNFDREVNIVQWGEEPVLKSASQVLIPGPEGAIAGWASVSVEANTTPRPNSDYGVGQAICDFTSFGSTPLDVECYSASGPVPLVGFAAWERTFSANELSNYGRAVDHSKANK